MVSLLYQFPLYPEGIPRELKEGRMWLCCDEAKVPHIAQRARRRASSTDPSTWRYFEDAVRAWRDCSHIAGIGRVISADEDLVGVDLDDVRDPDTGIIDTKAREILDHLDSYSEVSPSGTGVKIWLRSEHKRSHVKPGVEIYVRGRYFVATGQFLPQYPAFCAPRSAELAEIIEAEFPPRERPRRQRGARVPGFAKGSPDLEGLLRATGVEIIAELDDLEAEQKFMIICPWLHAHTRSQRTGTFVGKYPSGATWFRCYHAHCAGRGWREFVGKVGGRRRGPVRRPMTLEEVNVSYGR